MTARAGLRMIGAWLRSGAPFAAVAALSALVIHQLAYGVAAAVGEVHSVSDHGHLSAQWAVLTPLAVIGASALVLRQIRDLGFRSCDPGRLALASAAMFITQEAIEGAVGGSAAQGVLNVPVAIGLLFAPLVAAAVSRILSDVADVVARFVATPSSAPVPFVASFAPPPDHTIRPQVRWTVAPSRGPPVRLR